MPRTRFGPCLIGPFAFTWLIHSWMCAVQPVGWAVTQTKPRTFGLIIMQPPVFRAPARRQESSYGPGDYARPPAQALRRPAALPCAGMDYFPRSTMGPSALGTPP